MAKYVCTVCGYVYEGETLPADFKCPLCGVGADKFKKIEGEMTLAAEHEYGVYDSTVKNNAAVSDEDKAYILEQLKANFTGECSEVGICAWPGSLTVRAIPRSACTGRRPLMKKQSTLQSSQSSWAPNWSPT